MSDHRPDRAAVNQAIPVMPSVIWIRRPLAGLAGLSLLLFGHSMEARSGGCQSYEAAFNLEAGMRVGLTLKQAKARIATQIAPSPALRPLRTKINQMP